MDIEVHTDGSALWIDCPECAETITIYMSLPAALADMVQDAAQHPAVCGMSDDEEDDDA